MLDSLRPATSLTRENFHDWILQTNSERGIDLVETVVFMELHEHCEPHLNAQFGARRPPRTPPSARQVPEPTTSAPRQLRLRREPEV